MHRTIWRCKSCRVDGYTSSNLMEHYSFRTFTVSPRLTRNNRTKKTPFQKETDNTYPHSRNKGRKHLKSGHENVTNLLYEYYKDPFQVAKESRVSRSTTVKKAEHPIHQTIPIFENDDAFYDFRRAVIQSLKKWSGSPWLMGDDTDLTKHDVEKACEHFLAQMNTYRQNQYPASKSTLEHNGLQLRVLADAYKSGGEKQADTILQEALALYISSMRGLDKLVDLSNPAEWFPEARGIHRKIHLHVGPTNSGKTYNALKRLECAKSGWFAGPLRMLAQEVYQRLNKRGIKCNLVTGEQECIVDEGTTITSSTVEMTNINKRFEVGIIDEIQMIGDKDRGWAWTQAFFGLQVDELHLCGAESCVPLIEKLASVVGDKVEVHRYNRLGLLKPMETSLKSKFSHIQQGDCVVTFSRRSIFQLRRLIERETSYKCAVVYGTLPAEVRAEQARLFNDENSGYNVLVASDAVGMGLNLDIKRVIFNTLQKFDGKDMIPVEASQVKQISGRAGRFATSNRPYLGPDAPGGLNVGLVTTMVARDLRHLQDALKSPTETIASAGVKLPFHIVRALSRTFSSGMSLANVFRRIEELATPTGYFHLCQMKTSVQAAEIIQMVDGLTFEDKCLLCSLPVNLRNERMTTLLKAFAQIVVAAEPRNILSINCINIEILDSLSNPDKELVLRELEFLHREIMAFLWMSMRLPTIFVSPPITLGLKERTEKAISRILSQLREENALKGKKMNELFSSKNKKFAAQEIVSNMDGSEVMEERLVGASLGQ